MEFEDNFSNYMNYPNYMNESICVSNISCNLESNISVINLDANLRSI